MGNQLVPLYCQLFGVCPHIRESIQGSSTVFSHNIAKFCYDIAIYKQAFCVIEIWYIPKHI